MTILDRILESPWFWLSRVLSTVISLVMIWRIYMTDMILYTPAEYLPVLVLLGLAITGVLTILKGKYEYYETGVKKLRTGEYTEMPAYGMDYLAAHLGTIALGVVGAFIIPGLIYAAIGADPNIAGCGVIAGVWALFVGVKGATTCSEVADIFRDKVKIEDLIAAKKKPENPQ